MSERAESGEINQIDCLLVTGVSRCLDCPGLNKLVVSQRRT